MLIQFLKQPFPPYQKKWHFVIINVVCFASIFTIVASFLADDSSKVKTLIAVVGGYSAVAALGAVTVISLMPAMFKRFFDKEQWTRGKYFMLAGVTFLITGVANSALDYVLNNAFNVFHLEYVERNYYSYLFADMFITFMVGTVPTVCGYFFLNHQKLHAVLRKQKEQNVLLTERCREKHITDEKLLTLAGNTKDALTLFPSEVIYIEASGNYVTVNYNANGETARKMLRATLLQMEEQLGEYPFLVRCHRAFIVNTSCIEKIKGYTVRLKSTDAKIPVSRTWKNSFKS
jgi:hypothetical protein